MKQINVVLAGMVLLASSATAAFADDDFPAVDWDNLVPGTYVPGELLVGFRHKGVGPDKIMLPNDARNNIHVRVGSALSHRYRTIPADHVTVPAGISLKQAAAAYMLDPSVAYVEPNYIVHPVGTVPNDTFFSLLWGMERIEATSAWDFVRGSSNINIGVIDTGIDYTHPDLADNMWVNPFEDLNGNGVVDAGDVNGVDDDDNGYVDDFYGWDFFSDDNDPFDLEGHGTHVAGTIGAVGSNVTGVVGVNWDVSLVALRFLGPGGGRTADAIEAVEYMSNTNLRIRVSNNSWGGGAFSGALRAAIQEAGDIAGHVFVAAAGNDGRNTDEEPAYPASYDLSNIISVAAIDIDGMLADFSNFGANSVDIAAPGVDVLSSVPYGFGYDSYNGTSMACPHVAGAVALLLAGTPTLPGDIIKLAILGGARQNPNLSGKVLTGSELWLPGILDPQPFVQPSDEYRVGADLAQTNYFRESKTYEVINPSLVETNTIAITNLEPWIALSEVFVTLLPTSRIDVVVSIDPAAATNMPIGVYTGEVQFAVVGKENPVISRFVFFRIATNYVIRSEEYEWIDPVTNQHTELFIVSDLVSITVPIPFRFSYYDEIFSNLWVGSAGLVGLEDDGLDERSNRDMPSGEKPDAFIAPLWDAVKSRHVGSTVYADVEGLEPNRKLVITWDSVGHWEATTTRWDFQLIIEENSTSNDNDFVFQYEEIGEPTEEFGAGRSATIGLEDQYGIMVRRYSYNGIRWIDNGQALRFTKFPAVDTNPPTAVVRPLGNSGPEVTFEVKFDELVAILDTNDIVTSGNAPGKTVDAVDGGGDLYYVTIGNVTGLGLVVCTVLSNAVCDQSRNFSIEEFSGLYTMPYIPHDYFDDLEDDAGFWVASGEDPTEFTTKGWEWGTPDPTFPRGPGFAFSGTNCWGTRLGKDYTNFMVATLTSPFLQAGDHPEVRFWAFHDFDIEFDFADAGFVQANNGEGWEVISEETSLRGRTLGWRPEVIPLDNERFGNRPIQIRFRAVSDFARVGGGLYIDDIALASRRPSGFWVTNVTPSAAAASASTLLSFSGYNATTQELPDVRATVSVPASGASITGTDEIIYGAVTAGTIVTAVDAIDLTLAGVEEFDAPTIELIHTVTSGGDDLNVQFIPFEVLGVAPVSGDKHFTAMSTVGVRDWLGQPLQGDGSETSSLFQVIHVGPNGSADPALAKGGVTGDDQLLATLAEADLIGRIGEGVLDPNQGTFLKTFMHDLGSGSRVFVRAWEKATFLESLAYGDSALYTLQGDDVETNDFAGWSLDTPTDDARDSNGDGVPDSYYVLNGMDPRATGAVEPEWIADPLATGLPGMSFPGRVSASDSHVYIADTRNNRIIVANRSLDTVIQTYGSFGSGDGQFNWPEGLAYDPASGRVYVADTKNDRIVVLNVSGSGQVSFNFSFDGSAGAGGPLDKPYDVATDSSGNIYVADTQNSAIQKFNKLGTNLTFLGAVVIRQTQLATGDGVSSFFDDTTEGVVFHTPVIEGSVVVTAGVVTLTDDFFPGFLFGDDGSFGTIEYDTGEWSLFFLTAPASGEVVVATYLQEYLRKPKGIAVDSADRVIVADTDDHEMLVLNADLNTEIAVFGGVGTGLGELQSPSGVGIGVLDRIYVADKANNRIHVFSAAPTPVPLAMYRPPSGSVGSGPDQVRFPQGVWPVLDDDRHLVYVADTWNNRVLRMNLTLDTDNDGMEDVWEDLNGLDSSTDDSLLDKDSDGVTNIGEYRFGSDPCSSNAFPFVVSEGDEQFFVRSIGLNDGAGDHVSGGDRGVVFSWDASDGGIYEIQHCDDIVDGVWNAGTLVYSDDDGVITVTNSVPNSSRFFRIRWLNP